MEARMLWKVTRRRQLSLGVAVLLATLLTCVVPSGIPFALADAASAKAIVDAAKAQGVVGEQGDGFLGLVTGSADSNVTAAVAEINSGRAAVYKDAAARSGVTPAAAGQAAAKQIFERIPSGQYYKPVGGGWTRK
jgi:uncharacterized protein YdbL (DUF1318 family)